MNALYAPTSKRSIIFEVLFCILCMLIYSFILWTKWNNHHYLRVALVRESSTMQTTSAADSVNKKYIRIKHSHYDAVPDISVDTSGADARSTRKKIIWINEMNEIPMRHSVFILPLCDWWNQLWQRCAHQCQWKLIQYSLSEPDRFDCMKKFSIQRWQSTAIYWWDFFDKDDDDAVHSNEFRTPHTYAVLAHKTVGYFFCLLV